VLPMIISASPMWAGMAAIIFFGTLISMVLIVTVMPVAYWLLFRKEDNKLLTNNN
jgi:multidrug efflux pump subunit AcrB